MLPSLSVAKFKTNLISNGKQVEYRQFLAKEQKMLLMALEGGNAKDIGDAVMNMLNSCILTKDINVNKLPPFDVQHLFLELRKKSIGEVIELNVKHPEPDHQCNHAHKLLINLEDVQVNKEEGHNRKFKIDDRLGVVMRYPYGDLVEKFSEKNVKNTFALIAACIESVYDDEQVYSNFTDKEINEWVEQLNTDQLQKITSFFHTMPTLTYEINYTCEKCKEQVQYTLEGISDFFM